MGGCLSINEPQPTKSFIRKIHLAKSDYSGLYVPSNAKTYLYIYKPNQISIGTFDGSIHGIIDQVSDVCLLFQYPYAVAFKINDYARILTIISNTNLRVQRPGYWSNIETNKVISVYADTSTRVSIRNKPYLVPTRFKSLSESHRNTDQHIKKISSLMNFNIIPDDDLCKICFSQIKSKIYISCGHYCICRICYDNMRTKHCPMCRKLSVAIDVFV